MENNQKTTCKAWLTWAALMAFLAICTLAAQSCVTININQKPTHAQADTAAVESAWY